MWPYRHLLLFENLYLHNTGMHGDIMKDCFLLVLGVKSAFTGNVSVRLTLLLDLGGITISYQRYIVT